MVDIGHFFLQWKEDTKLPHMQSQKTALELIYLSLKWLEGNFLWGYPRNL
jgi:hypothetical protein